MVYEVQRKSYAWGDGYKPDIDADIVGSVCEKIEKKNGKITKELFLEASRPENSPTHSIFEWNDGVAAEKYRLVQARDTITHLRIIRVDSEKVEQKVKAFVNVGAYRNPKESGEYINIVKALSSDETKQIVIDRLRLEIRALIERNRQIEELADILIEEAQRLREEDE